MKHLDDVLDKKLKDFTARDIAYLINVIKNLEREKEAASAESFSNAILIHAVGLESQFNLIPYLVDGCPPKRIVFPVMMKTVYKNPLGHCVPKLERIFAFKSIRGWDKTPVYQEYV